MKWILLTLALSASAAAQSSALLFDDVKLFYQKPGDKNFRDDRGVLALDGAQKVMLVLKDNKPLLILRQDSITSITFEEKRDKTLTVRYGGASGPAGSVRMELPGKWKDILEALHAQSGQSIQMISKK